MSRFALRQCRGVALLAAILGCGDSSTGPGPTARYMTATVDGQPWAADRGPQTLVAELSSTGTLSVTGIDRGTTKSISIGIQVLSGPESYPLGPIPGSAAGYIEPGPPGLALSFVTTSTHTGHLLLESLDTTTHRIQGTFAFVGEGPGGSPLRTITAGRFAVTYTLGP